MEICLRRKVSPTTTAVTTSTAATTTTEVGSDVKPTELKKDLVFDDLELADSDREDYHNNVDILFVLDTTGSMGSYIAQAMVTIKKIVEKFSKMEFNIKFGLCTYRDHPPQESSYVTEFTDLSSAKKLLSVLSTVTAAGGGDGPEAVMDGLREGLTHSTWRLGEDGTTISKRFVFHICDAPPHGEEFGGGSSDPEWQKNGCPCGTKKEDINKLLKEKKVDYHLIKASNQVDKMEEVFKSCFGENFSETIVLNQSQPASMSHAEVKKSPHSDYLISTEVEKCCMDDADDLSENEEEEAEDSTKESCIATSATSEKKLKKAKSVSKKKQTKSTAEHKASVSHTKTEMWEGVLSALDKKLL